MDVRTILNSLDKNRPNIELLSDQINQRVLLSSSTDLKTVSCLQLKVFDKKINCKKVIEIFSADLLKQKIDLIIFFSKQSQYLIKTDWLLQIFDSYYLDDDDKFFYAIEYEYFDFCLNDVEFENQYQIINQLDNYCSLVIKYAQYAFQKINKDNASSQREKIKLMNFVLSQKQDGKMKIKLNTVELFVYESPLIVQQFQEQQPKRKMFTLQADKLDIPPFLNILFNKKNLSEGFKNMIQEVQENFEQIIREILDSFQLYEFNIFSYKPDKDSITIKLYGSSQTRYILFNIQKINSKVLFQQKLYDQNTFIQQLKKLDVRVLENSQAFSTSEGLFFVEYFDLSQQNAYFPLIESKNQFFEEVHKQYSKLGIYNENMISNFINMLFNGYKDQSDIIISKAKDLTLELINHHYDLNNLTAKSININQTSKVYCMCYLRHGNIVLSKTALISLAIKSLMHIILQELTGFNEDFYCLSNEFNKLNNSIAKSQKQLSHLKFDIHICDQEQQTQQSVDIHLQNDPIQTIQKDLQNNEQRRNRYKNQLETASISLFQFGIQKIFSYKKAQRLVQFQLK
ncbi:hypothetical protein ABPG74_018583 [Tetrahymena malaccensis]